MWIWFGPVLVRFGPVLVWFGPDLVRFGSRSSEAQVRDSAVTSSAVAGGPSDCCGALTGLTAPSSTLDWRPELRHAAAALILLRRKETITLLSRGSVLGSARSKNSHLRRQKQRWGGGSCQKTPRPSHPLPPPPPPRPLNPAACAGVSELRGGGASGIPSAFFFT